MRSIQNLISLQGKTAMVTGAGGVLGRVISQTLAELGADLLLVDRSDEGLKKTADSLPQGFDAFSMLNFDLEQQEQRHDLIEFVTNKSGSLSILVNNAAFIGDTRLDGWAVPFLEQTVETWRRAMEVNLTAVFDLCKGLSTTLMQAPGSSIVNIASLYGHQGPDWRLYEGTPMGNPAAYAASKGGLIQLTRWLATTLAPAIRVNTISPGGFFRNQPESFVEQYNKRTPLGRMAKEEDLKGSIAYLVSNMSAYVTGQNIKLDGGWSVW